MVRRTSTPENFSESVGEETFVHLAKVVMEGTFKPQLHIFTMATDEAITFVYNPALKDQVPETVKRTVADAKAKIITGELEIAQTYLSE